jgi:hypothetical protein
MSPRRADEPKWWLDRDDEGWPATLPKLTPAVAARKAATVERVMNEIRLALRSPRRRKSSSSVDLSGVEYCVEIYLRALAVVKDWLAERRKITYRDLHELLLIGPDNPPPIRQRQRSKKTTAQKIAGSTTLTNWLAAEDLEAELRAIIEHLGTRARHYAAKPRNKYAEEEVPKSPERYLAVSAAAWILSTLRPDRKRSEPIKAEPIDVTSYKGKGGRSTQLPETYSPLCRIAAALHWNEPVTPEHCWQMVKVCDKLLELRKRERP